MDVPMELSRILITEYGDQQMIFLKEIDGTRSFPIIIGTIEALAIDRRIKGQKPPRPMTHELLASVIEVMGGRLRKIVINDLVQHTFIATLFIEQNGTVLELDSRPSDAIALGVAMDTPIFVSDNVLDELESSSATPQERIKLLETRLQMLRQRIDKLTAQLEDERFLRESSNDTLEQCRQHIQTMTDEYDAIKSLLDKLA